MQGRDADSFASTSAVTNSPLLCESGTEQVGQVPEASTAGQASAASDGRVSEWFFTMLAQNAVSPTFSSGSSSLQCLLSRKGELQRAFFLNAFQQLRKRCFSFVLPQT